MHLKQIDQQMKSLEHMEKRFMNHKHKSSNLDKPATTEPTRYLKNKPKANIH